jgi:hypothetical protein
VTPKNDVPGDIAFPRFMIAVPPNVSTIRSPIDGQEGLAVFWTRAAAKRVARTKPGAIVVEATPEMFMDAIKKTHEMGVPWLYIGSELGSSVDFQRVRLMMALGQYARDGQHRHGEK